jgi:outer membrane protein insertion porin family
MDRLSRLLQRCAAGLFFWFAANCVFSQAPASVVAGPRIPVAAVIIRGSEMMSTPTVMSYLKTRAGGSYDMDTVQEDTRTLVGTKLFADVRVQVDALPDGRVNVYFLLRDLLTTIQTLEYRGAKHFKDDELNLVTDLRLGAPLNPTKNKLACQAIIRKYNEDGRPFAECYLLKGGKPGDTEVLFQITEGPQVKIGSLQFTGNRFVSGDVLATHIHSDKPILGVFGGAFSKETIEDDTGKLRAYYRSFGFHDVDISYEVQFQPNGHEAVVVFHIVEGKRFRLKDKPTVTGVSPATAEQLRRICKLKALDYFNGPELDRAAREMEDYLGYGGFNVRVQPIPIWSTDGPNLVTVQYEIDERR